MIEVLKVITEWCLRIATEFPRRRRERSVREMGADLYIFVVLMNDVIHQGYELLAAVDHFRLKIDNDADFDLIEEVILLRRSLTAQARRLKMVQQIMWVIGPELQVIDAASFREYRRLFLEEDSMKASWISNRIRYFTAGYWAPPKATDRPSVLVDEEILEEYSREDLIADLETEYQRKILKEVEALLRELNDKLRDLFPTQEVLLEVRERHRKGQIESGREAFIPPWDEYSMWWLSGDYRKRIGEQKMLDWEKPDLFEAD